MAEHGAMFLMAVSVLAICFFGSVAAHTAQEWKQRLIYQVLTDRFALTNGGTTPCNNLHDYCGGTFRGIINNLDYIENMGANAIWISPVPENTPGGYHGYWAQNIYNINPNFGSASDLRDLVNACHQRDIWVMLDVVGNHMGNQQGSQSDFRQFTPFNDPSHYHSYCEIQDWTDQHEVEVCRLAGLPDLAQENQFVSDTLVRWIGDMVRNYSLDGIRIDTVPEVNNAFWAKFAPAAGVFTIGEVDNGDSHYNANYQPPLDATLNYPFYWTFRNVFAGGQSMRQIHDRVEEERTVFHDRSVLGSFVDNHDNPRFLNLKNDRTILKNNLAYVIFGEGIPIIYYGTEQAFAGGNDPDNREDLWRSSYNVNAELYLFIRTLAKPQIERYVDDQFFAFTRDKVFVATTNTGCCAGISRHITFHPYTEGTVLQNILSAGDRVTVQNGAFDVSLGNGQPKVYYPLSSLTQSPDFPAGDSHTSGATIAIAVLGMVGLALVVIASVLVLRRSRRVATIGEQTALIQQGETSL